MKSRKLVLFLSLFLLLATYARGSASPLAESQAASMLTLHVNHVRNRTGVIRYAIFASEQGWPDDKSKAQRYGSLPANGDTVTFTVTGLPPGNYGISVLHDENENHKLDSDFFGRPKEGIGFGGNPKVRFSTPSWKQSSIQVSDKATETTILLRYP